MTSTMRWTPLFAALLVAAPVTARSQEIPPGRSFTVTSPPSLLNGPDLQRALDQNYPAAQLAAGVSAQVRVWMMVDRDGNPRRARVMSSSDTAFNAATLTAVRVLRFTPAQQDGRPVDQPVELPVVWQAARAQAAALAPGSGQAEEEVEHVQLLPRPSIAGLMSDEATPAVQRGEATGMVEIRFRVTEAGRTDSVQVVRSTNSTLNGMSMRVARRLRFSPQRVNGVPVAVWMTLPLRWSVQDGGMPPGVVNRIPPPCVPSPRHVCPN